ncbi:hypothetical protein [Candidatus Hydrogenosomobacter endosymbioticus]|uniref:Uncharacterized protein n=1 Tax=Candidatus Hydrogenosomobacter endosymbioticus TaxID=2558174 RepID=A0ABN6L789_9PROT|nr:hypothetical protein [Candidatus Hydrogenosomobacter endosymbioticus]BDB96361.1 hypothetical protein HYD_4940 [Candidatus Hydrogenosomobacter endosymbioticus]
MKKIFLLAVLISAAAVCSNGAEASNNKGNCRLPPGGDGSRPKGPFRPVIGGEGVSRPIP